MLRRSCIFLVSLLLCLLWGKVVASQPDYDRLVERGVELYQQGQVSQAIDNWQTALTGYDGQLDNRTIVTENLARAYQRLGKSDRALDYWQQTISNLEQLGNKQQLERSLTEQAQIYARMGQHQQAIALLCGTSANNCSADSAIAMARQQRDRLGEAAAWGSLGQTYRLRGDYQRALSYLETSLDIAQNNDLLPLQVSALNSLGNTFSSLAQVDYRRAASAEKRGDDFGSNNLFTQLNTAGANQDRRAIEYFSRSLQLNKGDKPARLKAIIDTIPIYYRLADNVTATRQIEQARSLLTIPTSSDKVYAAIALAKLLQPEPITPNTCYSSNIQPQAKELLQQAVVEAETLGDLRTQSFAVGELGHFYECKQEYRQALKLSQSARLLAEQELQARDSLYLWEWQTARIFQQQGNTSEAIRAYKRAIATLDSIRNDILTTNRDIQFDFRDTVEPIYRELIALELESVPTDTLVAATNDNLNSVLNIFDSLQLAELQNYFGNDCTVEEAIEDTDIDDDAVAVFHSIVLPQRTAIIATYPNGDRQLVWVELDSETIRQEAIALNEGLVRWYDNKYDPATATTLYQQIVSPFAQNLQQRKIQTLVFVQDGILRSVPMSALYDGQQYLIQQYAIATTPSLTVTKPEPFDGQNPKVLALGLTKSSEVDGRVYPPLPQVRKEILEIQREFQQTKSLLNQQFTSDRLEQELEQENYPIVHIASHGRFGTEPQDTFLIMGNDRILSMLELDRIIRNAPQGTEPIELLSLTACETALGDERATLGLAGVAVQAGAKSAIASLWSLDDGVTPQVVEQFYNSLQNSQLNKAQALQIAQSQLIEQNLHPAYWASFVLIGNWL